MGRTQVARERAVVAYKVLCGRPPKPDYALLIMLALVASAGGALIGLAVDMAVTRRATNRSGTADVPDGGVDSARVAGSEPAHR
jgi:hypothetical protein